MVETNTTLRHQVNPKFSNSIDLFLDITFTTTIPISDQTFEHLRTPFEQHQEWIDKSKYQHNILSSHL